MWPCLLRTVLLSKSLLPSLRPLCSPQIPRKISSSPAANCRILDFASLVSPPHSRHHRDQAWSANAFVRRRSQVQSRCQEVDRSGESLYCKKVRRVLLQTTDRLPVLPRIRIREQQPALPWCLALPIP